MAAGITSSVSGSVWTYVVTDQEGNTVTVTQTVATTGNTSSFASSANGLLYDGQQLLVTLMLQLSTGLLPSY